MQGNSEICFNVAVVTLSRPTEIRLSRQRGKGSVCQRALISRQVLSRVSESEKLEENRIFVIKIDLYDEREIQL